MSMSVVTSRLLVLTAILTSVQGDCANNTLAFPINLQRCDVTEVKSSPLKFNNFDVKPEKLTVANDIYDAVTVMPTFANGTQASITVDGLNGVYKLYQISFGYGTSNSAGASHVINCQTFPLEVT